MAGRVCSEDLGYRGLFWFQDNPPIKNLRNFAQSFQMIHIRLDAGVVMHSTPLN